MEVKETIKTHVISLEGSDIGGEAKVVNGAITTCLITAQGTLGTQDMEINEVSLRELHRELGALIKFVDDQKGVGNVQ